MNDLLSSLGDNWQLNGVTLVVLSKLAGELFSAIRKGGGLRRIILSVWFGENVPAPIADDYKAELNTKKTPEAIS